MPRKLRDTSLDNRTARSRLKAQGKPHWRRISARCHLGYRRNKTGGGSWVGRRYDGSKYQTVTLGAADDERPADGASTLTFSQAQEAVQKWFADEENRAAGLPVADAESYTVAECMEDYLAWYELHRKGLTTVRGHTRVHILPTLGSTPVSKLTTPQLRKWHEQIARSPSRQRSAKGESPNFGEIKDAEDVRKRKHTANHALATLRAALNMAFREGRVDSDKAWRRVRPFKGVCVPKVAYLEIEEVQRLLDACAPEFRQIVHGALLTGCRYGELCQLRVKNFDPANSAIYVEKAKGGKSRHVFLSEEGQAVFEELTAGRAPSALLFLRADGDPWGRSHQSRRIKNACKDAEIDPPISFHILRHTYASHYLMNGGSLTALSKQLGHADTRMTTLHYGHLADQWRAEEARKHAPSFGTQEASNVVRFRKKVASQ